MGSRIPGRERGGIRARLEHGGRLRFGLALEHEWDVGEDVVRGDGGGGLPLFLSEVMRSFWEIVDGFNERPAVPVWLGFGARARLARSQVTRSTSGA